MLHVWLMCVCVVGALCYGERYHPRFNHLCVGRSRGCVQSLPVYVSTKLLYADSVCTNLTRLKRTCRSSYCHGGNRQLSGSAHRWRHSRDWQLHGALSIQRRRACKCLSFKDVSEVGILYCLGHDVVVWNTNKKNIGGIKFYCRTLQLSPVRLLVMILPG